MSLKKTDTVNTQAYNKSFRLLNLPTVEIVIRMAWVNLTLMTGAHRQTENQLIIIYEFKYVHTDVLRQLHRQVC